MHGGGGLARCARTAVLVMRRHLVARKPERRVSKAVPTDLSFQLPSSKRSFINMRRTCALLRRLRSSRNAPSLSDPHCGHRLRYGAVEAVQRGHVGAPTLKQVRATTHGRRLTTARNVR